MRDTGCHAASAGSFAAAWSIEGADTTDVENPGTADVEVADTMEGEAADTTKAQAADTTDVEVADTTEVEVEVEVVDTTAGTVAGMKPSDMVAGMFAVDSPSVAVGVLLGGLAAAHPAVVDTVVGAVVAAVDHAVDVTLWIVATSHHRRYLAQKQERQMHS